MRLYKRIQCPAIEKSDENNDLTVIGEISANFFATLPTSRLSQAAKQEKWKNDRQV